MFLAGYASGAMALSLMITLDLPWYFTIAASGAWFAITSALANKLLGGDNDD